MNENRARLMLFKVARTFDEIYRTAPVCGTIKNDRACVTEGWSSRENLLLAFSLSYKALSPSRSS